MRKKLPILLLALIILLQAFSPAVFAASKKEATVSTVSFCSSDTTPEGAGKSVDDILSNASPGRVTKGKTTLYEKSGGFGQASNEFESLNPLNVKDINTSYGSGKTGTLPDGRTVTVRPGSSDGRPTLEIRDANGRGVEVRYGK